MGGGGGVHSSFHIHSRHTYRHSLSFTKCRSEIVSYTCNTTFIHKQQGAMCQIMQVTIYASDNRDAPALPDWEPCASIEKHPVESPKDAKRKQALIKYRYPTPTKVTVVLMLIHANH